MKKLPLSIQTFEKIRSEDYLYVDKTTHIHKLTNQGTFYFLSRPPHFGKSLFLSTLKAYFEGKKALFEGLQIFQLEKNWAIHPVIHLDLSQINYKSSVETFKKNLRDRLELVGSTHQIPLTQPDISHTLVELITGLHQAYRKGVVVLIDEYDRPLLDSLHNIQLYKRNLGVLRMLTNTLKSLDTNLRFVMLTGVSRFAKTGIFSGLNSLDDISLNAHFGTLAGFSQKELDDNFVPYLVDLQRKFDFSNPVLKSTIQEWYYGYSFDGEQKVYNPFSILKLFAEKDFRNHWLEMVPPAFFMERFKQLKCLPQDLEQVKQHNITGGAVTLKSLPIVPLLFQMGYLTLKSRKFENFQASYMLDYPNKEIRLAFITELTTIFLNKSHSEVEQIGFELRETFASGKANKIKDQLAAIYQKTPNRVHLSRSKYNKSLLYLLLRLMGSRPISKQNVPNEIIGGEMKLNNKRYFLAAQFLPNKRIKRVTTLSKKAMNWLTEEFGSPSESHSQIHIGIGFLEGQIHVRKD